MLTQSAGDILEVYPSTVEALPAVTICQLLYNHVEQNLGGRNALAVLSLLADPSNSVNQLVTRLARSITTSTAEVWQRQAEVLDHKIDGHDRRGSKTGWE